MALTTGVVTSYNTTSNIQARSYRDLVDRIEFENAPLLKLLGLSNQGKFGLQDWPRIKYEWFGGSMPTRATTLNEGGTLNNSDLTFTVTDGTIFKDGDVLLIETELVSVSSVATNDVTVRARGGFGSTAATHADGTAVTKVTIARKEGVAYTVSPTTTVDNYYNYTQILEESVEMSRSEQQDTKYAVDDWFAYQIAQKLSDGKSAGVLPQMLELSFYYGKRHAGTSALPRMMGGFHEFQSTHVYDLNGATLDLPHIEQAMQDCYDDGGKPNTLVLNSFARRKVSEWFKGNVWREEDDTLGGVVIDKIRTDFGDVRLVHDWLCPANRIYLLQPEFMGWVEFFPFSVQDVPVNTDSKVKRILGEYGFVLRNEQAHAYIHDFSTTA